MLAYALSIFGGRLQSWHLECVRRLQESGTACLQAAIDDPACFAVESGPLSYERFMRGLKIRSLRSGGSRQLKRFRGDLPIVDAWPRNGSIDWERDVRRLGLDFILHVGERSRGIQLSRLAKYGAWTFVYGEPPDSTTAAPGFWECYEHREVVNAALVQLRTRDVTGVVLKKSAFPVNNVSLKHVLEQMLPTVAMWPAQVCADIAAGVAGYFEQPAVGAPRLHYGIPSATQILRLRAGEMTYPVRRNVTRGLSEAPVIAETAP